MSYFDDDFISDERQGFQWPNKTIKYKGFKICTEINGEKQDPGEWDAEIVMEILEEIMKNTITEEEIKVLREIVGFFLPDKNIDIDVNLINQDWKSIVGDIKNNIH